MLTRLFIVLRYDFHFSFSFWYLYKSRVWQSVWDCQSEFSKAVFEVGLNALNMILSFNFLAFFTPAAAGPCLSLVCSDVFQAQYPVCHGYSSMVFIQGLYRVVAMAQLAIWDCLVLVLIWHGLVSIAEAVQFVPSPNVLSHLISRMPRRHQAWKACNGFMYRLHVGFSLQPFSRALSTAVFMFRFFRKAYSFYTRKKRQRLVSGAAPHEQRWLASMEGLLPCLLLNREVISLMKCKGCRVYSGTDKHIEYYIAKTKGSFCYSFANRSSRTFSVAIQTDVRTGRASASQQLVPPVLQ